MPWADATGKDRATGDVDVQAAPKGGDGMTELIKSTRVKTAKNHQCFGCLVVIRKGEHAASETYRVDDSIYSIHLCDDCDEFRKTLPKGYWGDEGGYYEGELALAKELEGWSE